jgi:hypothetical protein
MSQYEVSRGSLKFPSPKSRTKTAVPRPKFLAQGEIVPDGMLSDEEIESLLADGRIKELRGRKASKALIQRKQKKGKWACDPKSLVGKDMEALLMLVLGIDEDFDVSTIKSKAQAIKQLTKDWDVEFSDPIAKSYDSNTPGLTPDGVQTVEPDEDAPAPGERARALLEKAKAKAAHQAEQEVDED